MSALLLLVFTACAGPKCHPVELPWNGTMEQCRLFAQIPIAEWVAARGMTRRGGWQCLSGRPA
jgi:hypothetical protein